MRQLMFAETGSFKEPPPNTTKRPGRGKSLHCLINSVTVRVTSSHPTNYTSCPPREAAPCEAPPAPAVCVPLPDRVLIV